MENSSAVSSIILSAYFGMEDLKYLYFSIFLILYIAIVAENVILIGVIYTEKTLHQPMYFLVCNLAANGLYGSTALLPALLKNVASHPSEVSLASCRTQIYCIHTYAIVEFTILGVMSYDRYVAICHPLRYHTIMSLTKVYKLVAFTWIYPLVAFLIFFIITLQLRFCDKTIDKLYCINYLLIKLSFCALSSKESKLKALRTCTPHLFAIINYFVGCYFEILQSRFDTSHLPYRTQVFMSLYFLIFPPILNPAIYGLSIQAIRVKLLKLCYNKNRILSIQ
ncbi:olfactory receptor 52D1-like [Oncorhynchus tshawytscha]|uniref:olfactory receptor 52D1-like n=1 Tax=Oncorhynchus tshawytscha TaxID=74940 RepID=UPI001C3E2EC7|nr:olfactory receptor 52D1-like [Oncorhynchus tshawytscha]